MIERAAILSTGDEITTGKVVDTNSNYIADKLIEAGLDVPRLSRLVTFRTGFSGPGNRPWFTPT